MKIVVLEPLGVSSDQLKDIGKIVTDRGHELIIYEDKTDDQEVLKDRIKEAEILIIANMPLGKELIDAAENLKMISIAFTGVDHVDLDACKQRGIKVSNAANYSTSSVAELAFALMISLLRNIVPLDEATRLGKTMEGYPQFDLFGRTLGVIGTGTIGTKVAEIGLAFGCNVIAYNRTEKEDLKSKGVEYLSLDELLERSDIVTIHLPNNKETLGLISKEKIKLMKDTALLINTARGPIIDNNALADALKNKEIAGAGIDVYDMEPPLALEYPLINAPNTVVLPHIGFATKEAMIRRAYIIFENIVSWEDGKQQNIIL